jgi:DtxR family transcriptional regulator, Mn-dependent transcriptional regulator
MNGENGREFHTVRGYELLHQQKDRLTPAMEDYLEMVYRLCELSQYTRIGKLSEALHVRPSSASKMILKLSEKGFVDYDRYEIILPTEKGKNAGAYLMHRHKTVERFLYLIGSKELLKETELIEHVLSPGTVFSINTLLAFFERNDLAKAEFESFQEMKKENI